MYACTGRYLVQASAMFLKKLSISLSLLQTKYKAKSLLLSVKEEYLVDVRCLHVVVQPADEVGHLN